MVISESLLNLSYENDVLMFQHNTSVGIKTDFTLEVSKPRAIQILNSIYNLTLYRYRCRIRLVEKGAKVSIVWDGKSTLKCIVWGTKETRVSIVDFVYTQYGFNMSIRDGIKKFLEEVI